MNKNITDKEAQEYFLQGAYDVDFEKIAKMSPLEFAEWQSQFQLGTPQAIIADYEWRKRDRNEQHILNKKIMFRASIYGWLGAILGAIVGAILTFFLTQAAQQTQSQAQVKMSQQNSAVTTKTKDLSLSPPLNPKEK